MTGPRPQPRRWGMKLTILAVLAILAGLWFGPRMADWSAIKPEIAEILSDQFDVEVKIRGGLQIVLLPQPRITVGDIRIDGERVSGTIRWVRGSLDPGALAIGRFVPRDVELVEADLTMPIAPSGAETYDAQTSVSIRDAQLTLTGGPDWLPNRLEKLQGHLSLGGRLGRLFSFDGEARVIGEPVGISVEGHSGGTLVLGLAHGPSAADLAVQGGANAAGGWNGRATLVLEESGFLSTLNADALARLLGDGPATLDARIVATSDGVLALDVEAIESAHLSGTGTATLVQGNRPAFDLSLDLDEAAIAADPMAARALSSDLSDALRDHADIDVSVTVKAREIQTLAGPIKSLRLSVAAGGGVAVIDQASAILPGDTDLSLFGMLQPSDTGWQFDGEAGIAARNFRAGLLALFPGLSDSISGLPADRLRRVDLTARVLAAPDVLEVAELTGRIDDTNWDGAISLGDNGSLEMLLQGDRLNLDRYTGAEGLSVLLDPILSALQVRASDQRLSLYLDRLSYDRIPAEGVSVTMMLNQGNFSIDLAIDDLAGATGSATLDLTGSSIAAAGIALTIPKPDRFLGAFGLGARQAATLARLGETEVTLDLSVTPDNGIGYALEGLGSGGDFRANGLFVAFPFPVISVTDGAFNLGDLTVFDLSGVCGSDGLGGWNCGELHAAAPGLRLAGNAWVEPLAEPETGQRLQLDLTGAEADLGLFLARTGLPLLPEGEAILSGSLIGQGVNFEAALRDLRGSLVLGGQAALHVRPGGGGRLGNLDRLRRNLEGAFGALSPMTGVIEVQPNSFSTEIQLDGNGARVSAQAGLSRPANQLTSVIEVSEDGRSEPVMRFTAEGPLGAPGIRLSGPWVSGR